MFFPFLSVIIFTPLTGALVIMALPKEKHQAIKVVATVAAFIPLVLAVYVYFAYDMSAGGLQWEEGPYQWVPGLGITYHLGADGINLPLLLLTGIVIFSGVLISWVRERRPKEFFALLLILVTGVLGVFSAMDLFLLFVFYELAVLPMYLLIGIWGTTRKLYAAMKLTLYLLVGSAFSLVGGIAMYFAAGKGTFDLVALSQATYDPTFQKFFFLPIFVGFSVLAGLWPFHTWSPDGHVAAPTAVSMLHAGVLMKLGAYSALRVGVVTLPRGAHFWLPLLVLLTVVNVVYGATVALAQRDFKYVIGYSSVSHMGFVTMGVATMNQIGLAGATLQMFSHGVMTGIFFAVVGLVYRRAHTRDIPSLGGLWRRLPWAAVAFMIGGFASMGMPGFSGFIAEFQILVGVWRAYPVIAAISGLGILVTAAYIMRVVYMVFFGPLKEEYADIPPEQPQEKIALALMCSFLIIIGVFPAIMVDLINTGVAPIVAKLASVVP